MKRLLLIGLAVICSGCTAGQLMTYRVNEIDYDIAMVDVERPAETEEKWGQTDSIELLPRSKYRYEDSLLVAEFTPERDQVIFDIANKTDRSIKLIWDEAAFIDIDGTAKRLMHIGVRYGDRNAVQPPSVIPAHGRISDAVNPTDRVFFRKGYRDYWHGAWVPGDWEHHSLIRPYLEVSEEGLGASDSLKQAAQEQVGKRIGLLFPLHIEGVTNEYTFWFEVMGYEVLAPVPPHEHDLFK